MKCSFDKPAQKKISTKFVVVRRPKKIKATHFFQEFLISANCSIGDIGSILDIYVKKFENQPEFFAQNSKATETIFENEKSFHQNVHMDRMNAVLTNPSKKKIPQNRKFFTGCPKKIKSFNYFKIKRFIIRMSLWKNGMQI